MSIAKICQRWEDEHKKNRFGVCRYGSSLLNHHAIVFVDREDFNTVLRLVRTKH